MKTMSNATKLIGKKCIFCPKKGDTVHHIIPKSVRKVVGWNGKQANKYMLKRKVPMCRRCHDKLNALIDPIVFILKAFKPEVKIPIELSYMIEDSIEKLMEEEDE